MYIKVFQFMQIIYNSDSEFSEHFESSVRICAYEQHFPTPFLLRSTRSHPSFPLLTTILARCFSCKSPLTFLVNISASFSDVRTKTIFRKPSMTNSWTNRYLTSMCLVLCDTATFSAINMGNDRCLNLNSHTQ